MQIANDLTPGPRNISALERGYRAIDWVTTRINERGKLLNPDEREARAQYYDERAASYIALAKIHPAMLEFAGLNNLAANIMRSEVLG